MNSDDVQFWMRFEWCLCRLTLNDEFHECLIKLYLGLRCMLAHSKQWISKMFQLIAQKWSILRLASNCRKIFGGCGWVAVWWCVVELIHNKCFLFMWKKCALKWSVLRLTLNYKNDEVQNNCRKVVCALPLFSMNIYFMDHGA